MVLFGLKKVFAVEKCEPAERNSSNSWTITVLINAKMLQHQ